MDAFGGNPPRPLPLQRASSNPNKRKITNLSPGLSLVIASVSDSILFPPGCDPVPQSYFSHPDIFLYSGTTVQRLGVSSISRAREQRRRRSGDAAPVCAPGGAGPPTRLPCDSSQFSFDAWKINSGVAQWLACWAHNPKVRGSETRSATFVRAFILVCSDMCACWSDQGM